MAMFLLSRKENTEVKFSTLSAGIFLIRFNQFLSPVILTPQWWADASSIAWPVAAVGPLRLHLSPVSPAALQLLGKLPQGTSPPWGQDPSTQGHFPINPLQNRRVGYFLLPF